MDPETQERFAALEARMRGMESAAADPWTGPLISLDPPGPRPALVGPTLLPDGEDNGFWARIGAATAAGYRWTYAFVEVAKTAAGYGGWTTLSGGRSGTAYNTIEDVNSASGVQGNGVTRANLDTADYTFAIMPCTEGNVVWMREVIVGAVTEYWFFYENGVDGSCD